MPAVGTERSAQPPGPEDMGRDRLTLEPLRSDGPDALNTLGLQGIVKSTLREIEIVSDNALHDVTIRRSDDLFKRTAADGPAYDPIPTVGRLTRATFEVHLAHSPEPCAVDIRPPNTLKVARASDTQLIRTWLSKKGFLKPASDNPENTGGPNAGHVEVA